MDLKTLKKIDTSKMYTIYDKWSEIGEKQYNSDFKLIEISSPKHIVFSGMGGSGAISDLFSSILSKTNIHVDVVKGYILPKTVDSDSLVICISISGNTAETLSILEQANKIGCSIIAFSDGGKMERFSNKKNIHFIKIPVYHSPRASFTSYLYSMLKVLGPILPIDESDIIESLKKMKELEREICSDNLTEENPALNLAKWLPEVPVIYFPWGLESAAIRFKNSLQENSKMHVIAEDIIEACHNGIVSWDRTTKMKPILIEGRDDYIKTKERWTVIKKFFEERNIDFKEIYSVEGSIISKLINLIYLFDYTSIYKAVIDGIDPTSVEPINFVKRKI